MSNKYKRVYVGFKFLHMGMHAGYDLIKGAASYDLYVDCQEEYGRFLQFVTGKSFLSRVYTKLFGSYMLLVELKCLLVALRARPSVFHFIYAENTYRYLGFFKWLGFKVVCTFHQPISFFEKNPEYLRGLRFVDKAIVLSEDLRGYFSREIGSDRVVFVPHGVDTDFFSPAVCGKRKKEVLMVGNWMRNFQFASEVFERLLRVAPEVSVCIVSLPENKRYFEGDPRIKFLSGISDDELLERYRSASVLFLPLNGFVANNAVLEMASVGAPVVIASNQTPDETLAPLVTHVELDHDSALSAILDQLNDDASYSAELRNFVLNNYSWQVIGRRTKALMVFG